MEKSELKTMGIWIMLLSVFIVQLLLYTWCRVECVQIGYEIGNEENNQREFISVQNNLKIELARLKSPERISEIAKNRMGLSIPAPEQMLTILH